LRADVVSSRDEVVEALRGPVLVFILINLGFFISTSLGGVPLSFVQLQHKAAATNVIQFVTCAFTHTSLEALCQSVFFIYIFGRMVERSYGAAAVTATYLSCALGGWNWGGMGVKFGWSGCISRITWDRGVMGGVVEPELWPKMNF
jgi:membrane associated rhomboid family serine protease